MATAFDRQIQNRNFLSPVGFKFILGKHPKVDFISQSANIPDISLATQIQPSYLKDIDVPGDAISTTSLLTIPFDSLGSSTCSQISTLCPFDSSLCRY